MHMTGTKERTSLTIVDAAGKPQMVVDRDGLNAKNAGRKADRQFIAAALLAIVERHGALVEQHESPAAPGFGGAGLDLRFSLNGVGAMIDLDNLHGGAWSLISWHNTEYPARDFTTRFCVAVGDIPKSRPHHKATSHPGDWYSLAMRLDAGLCLAFANQAFVPVHDL